MSKIEIASQEQKSNYAEDVIKVCDQLGIERPNRNDLAFSWIIECIQTGYELEGDEDPDFFNEELEEEADRLVPIMDFERAMVWVELQQYREDNTGEDYIQAFSQRLYDIAFGILLETQSGVLA
ncbi:MAG: hypothetical protein ACTSQB_02335 [Candidatus Heimdallarchaeota archaeon]